MHERRLRWLAALLSLLIACADRADEELATNSTALSLDAPRELCTIRLGADGKTQEYNALLAEGEQQVWSSVPASDFVRSTSGPCHFRIHVSAGLTGKSVVLGSDLSVRIRAGADGITHKDTGGGDTWRVRSLVVYRVATACRLRVGGNGVRMDYFADDVDSVPGMDRVDALGSADCAVEAYAAPSFGDDDPERRFKLLHSSAQLDADYDPGFRVRSLAIRQEESDCPELARAYGGRCLPRVTLSGDIYDSAGDDADEDGLDDQRENELAEAFAPAYFNDDGENATRSDLYLDASGQSLIEPATIYQVRSAGDGLVVIQYMRLWLEDVWGSPTCPGHHGDSQRHGVYMQTSGPESEDHGRLWIVYQLGGGIQDDLQWHAEDGSLRSPHFIRMDGEQGPGRHLSIYFSKGKHHEYADTGWSGALDKDCVLDHAYVNGRGALHAPSYPPRLASLRSPSGAGDRFDYSNVGSSSHPFFDDLAAFGFDGECVFQCGDFYQAEAPDRGFE